MNRINEYVGRRLAILAKLGLIENVTFKDFGRKEILEFAFDFDFDEVSGLKDKSNFQPKPIDLLRNLNETWQTIYSFHKPSKLWAGDITAAYHKGLRDIFVHSYLSETKLKYNELGFFSDEFQDAKEGKRMLSEDRYRALAVIFDLEKNGTLSKPKILALYRIMLQYASYSDIKSLSNKWLCSCPVSAVIDGSLDLNSIEWEYKFPSK